MAQKPDGKPNGVEKVAFTRPAAERIAKVVRQVEAGERDADAFGLGVRIQSLPAKPPLRFCSWTATWLHGSTATITFDPATSMTATAVNAVLGFGPGKGWVAGKGTAGWQLIGADLTLQPGYSTTEIQLFGHKTGDVVAQWYSITTCSTATA